MKYAIILIAVCLISTRTTAQIDPKNPSSSPQTIICLKASDVQAPQLYGQWVVEFLPDTSSAQDAPAGSPRPTEQRGRMVLEKNPEFADSISGWLYLGYTKILVVGDVEDAVFSLEESLDGEAISAVWDGAVVEGSCGKAIAGVRRVGETTMRFVLQRAKGWN